MDHSNIILSTRIRKNADPFDYFILFDNFTIISENQESKSNERIKENNIINKSVAEGIALMKNSLLILSFLNVFIILTTNGSITLSLFFKQHPDKKLKEHYRQKHQACEKIPDLLKTNVEKVKEVSKLNLDNIVLLGTTLPDCKVLKNPFLSDKTTFLLISLEGITNFHDLDYNLMRQLGHIALDHHSKREFIKDKTYELAHQVSPGSALLSFMYLQKYTKNRWSRQLGSLSLSGFIGIGIYTSTFFLKNYEQSKKEQAADEFAYTTFVQQGYLRPVVSSLYHYLSEYEKEEKYHSTIHTQLLDGVPSPLERAQTGIKILQKQSPYTVKEIVENLAESGLDKETQKNLPRLIIKYFPETLSGEKH